MKGDLLKMTEKVKNVSSDSENEIDSLFEEGYEEWIMDNHSRAIELFEQVLEKKPDNYKAIFYRLLSIAKANEESELLSFVSDFIPIADARLDEVVNSIRKQNNNDRDFTEACVEFVVELSIICCGALRLLDKLDKNVSYEPKVKTVIILNNFLINILNILDNTDDVCDGFFEMLMKYMIAYRNDVDGMTEKNYNECFLLVSKHFNQDVLSADLRFSESRTEKSQHKVERLSEEITELDKEFKELEKVVREKLDEKKSNFECEETTEKESILNEVNTLVEQRKSLYIFNFSKKKRLKLLIEEKNEAIEKLDDVITEKKRARDNALLDEAREKHEKAGILVEKIQRNHSLSKKMVESLELWFRFTSISCVKEG